MTSKKTVVALIVIVILGISAFFYADHRIRSEVDTQLQSYIDDGLYQELSYEGLSYDLSGKVSLHKLLIKEADLEYVLERVDISNMDYSHDFPHHVKVEIDGVSFPDGLPAMVIAGNNVLLQYLQKISQDDHIPLHISYSHNYQETNDQQFDSLLSIALPDFLSLAFHGAVRKLPIEDFLSIDQDLLDPLAAQAQLLPLMNNAQVDELKLSMDDLGFVQTYMQLGAEQMGVAADDYRNMLIGQISTAYMFMPPNTHELIKNYSDQVAVFLEGGHNLTVSIRPGDTGNVEELQTQIFAAALTGDFAHIAKLLNLEVVSK